MDRLPFKRNFYVPLQIAFNTGMRASEVYGFTWDYIDIEKGKIKNEELNIY
ncbi:site-specific integrase [Tepidibacter mesophilus]|uniref:hypothetical protein n=1 Tax=Tepidibacter mesophilus TaxID=655607 RepID=UPI002E8DFEE1|nr:hypothetical protein [Tepidibacter mesophilus]